MSKAITGAAELAGAVGIGITMAALASTGAGAAAFPFLAKAMFALAVSGISSEIGAISQALTSNRGINITDRRPASNRQIIYGTQMVGGTLVYESVTGHQYNQVIMIAGHELHSIQAIFLDGRKVVFQGSGVGWTVRNGVGFGGDALNHDEIGPDGVTHYNFGGKVYCEARYGDQTFGDFMGSINGNDPNWGPKPNGDVPSLVGCAYIYLKCTAGTQFPQRPEVRILVNGKKVLDYRTGLTAFSNNAALVLADVITDPQYGLGDSSINTAQIIAAANICDEQVAVAALGGATESRYGCDYSYDTGTAPADVMSTMLTGMAGRISYVGGQWFIFPGAYIGPNLSYDQGALTAAVQWSPARSVRDLPNRITGTHISAEYPYSVAGNFYQNRQTVQNNFDLKFTQSSYPYYAQDQLHGYPTNQWLTEDGGRIRPMELGLPTVLSVTQCQRVAKISLLRARAKQGNGTLEMGLSAYRLQPCDTFNMTFPQMSWDNEVLEVTGTSLRVESSQTDEGEVFSIRYALNVQSTDSSIYTWSTSEELTIFAAAAAPSQTPLTPVPPTNLQLFSGPATAIVGQDGSVTPVIQVTWDTPLDNAAVGILIQYMQVGGSAWFYAPTADISLNVGLIAGVIAGQHYNVRIATVRANGATSDFVEHDNFAVPSFASFLGLLGAQWPGGANLPAPGADVTGQQAISYTGISGNLIPNGDFILGNIQGWLTPHGGYDPGVPGLNLAPSGEGAISPSFALQPGNRYRLSFTIAPLDPGAQSLFLRIICSGSYAPNILALGNDGNVVNFVAGATIPFGFATYTYEFDCPVGVFYASLAIYDIAAASIGIRNVVAQDFGASAEWGADVTGTKTSNDTSFVSGVPSGVIASVVPTGFKLFINSGAKSYSIEAI